MGPAHKDFCSRGEAGGKRRKNLTRGLPFELLPQGANMRGGLPMEGPESEES